MERKEKKAIIEAVLFSMGTSVEADKLSQLVEENVIEIKKIIREMIEEMKENGSGLTIMELEDSFQMCAREEMYDYLIRIAKIPKKHVLTEVLLETLSIIAYKQPVMKLEIEKIRGVNCDHAINRLIEYDLIKEIGRLDAPGRPLLFGTTEQFLRSFGVKSLDDLPALNPERLEEFKEEAEQEATLQLKV